MVSVDVTGVSFGRSADGLIAFSVPLTSSLVVDKL